MQEQCRFCLGYHTQILSDSRRAYCCCYSCGGIGVLPEYYIPEKEQKARYLLHTNSLADTGYEQFLRRFIEPIAAMMREWNVPIRTVFDYGAGPEPALCELMKTVIFPDAEIRGWDPFFLPDGELFADGADLVTCLEVAEHFECVDTGFEGLVRACRPGGFVGVGTMTVPADIKKFLSWWYKEDCTHVSFYTKQALETAAARHGLRSAAVLSDRVFLFRRAH